MDYHVSHRHGAAGHGGDILRSFRRHTNRRGRLRFTITWTGGFTGTIITTTYQITIYPHVAIEGAFDSPEVIVLPNATVGEPYTATLTISGGLAPYTGFLVGGVPSGLSLTTSGSSIVLTWTPTFVQEATFGVGVIDTLSFTAGRNVSISVQDKPDDCKVVNLIRTLPAPAQGDTFDVSKLEPGKPLDFRWTSDTEGKNKTFIVKMSKKPIGEEGAEEPFASFKVKNQSGTTKDGSAAGVAEIPITQAQETLEITITGVFGRNSPQREYVLRVSCKDKPASFQETRFYLVGATCKLDVDGKRLMCEQDTAGDFVATATVQGGKIKSGRSRWTLDKDSAKVKKKGDAGAGAQTLLDIAPKLTGAVARSEATVDRGPNGVLALTVVADGILEGGTRFRCAQFFPAFIIVVRLEYLKARRALCIGGDPGKFEIKASTPVPLTLAGTVIFKVKGNIEIVSPAGGEADLPANGRVTAELKAKAAGPEERGPEAGLPKLEVRLKARILVEGKELRGECGLGECPIRLLKRRTLNVVYHVAQVGGVNKTAHAAVINAAGFPAKAYPVDSSSPQP